MNRHRHGQPGWVPLVFWTMAVACLFARTGATSKSIHAVDQSALDAVQREVITNIVNQPVGSGTLADSDLPEAFLRRLADRIIRASYHDRFHRVYRDVVDETPDEDVPQVGATPPPHWIKVLPRAVLPSMTTFRATVDEGRPTNRGFRAPILGEAQEQRHPDLDRASLSPAEQTASDLIASRLARDGLLLTLAHVLDVLGAETFRQCEIGELEVLRRVGLPVDLLEHFSVDQAGEGESELDVVHHIAGLLVDERSTEGLIEALRSVSFHFAPSNPAFRVVTESGESDIAMLRLQMTRGTYWREPGAGGALDVARQLVQALPDVRFAVSIEQRFAESFLQVADAWATPDTVQLVVLTELSVVSQWAQDNGKAGVIATGNTERAATLVPRYASRREDGSMFIPGESWLVESLAATGHPVVHSPLLFQGGDLLPIRDPRTGRRLLLIGEAEIYRNTSLGLSKQQVLDAFVAEFGVDVCIVLPSISFHIDYDVSVRAQGDQLVAFVNDTQAAVQIIVACGIDAMARGGLLRANEAATAQQDLDTGRYDRLLQVVAAPLYGRVDEQGRFPLSLARHFAVDDADSPVGNLHRFLVALDLLAALQAGDQPIAGTANRAAYFRSMQRMLRDQDELEHLLQDEGFHIVKVPSLAAADRSINSINGIHDPARYIMPAHGGLYSPLDEAAARAFAQALAPGVTVIPILCAESQRRSGGVHCSAAAYPASKLPAVP